MLLYSLIKHFQFGFFLCLNVNNTTILIYCIKVLKKRLLLSSSSSDLVRFQIFSRVFYDEERLFRDRKGFKSKQDAFQNADYLEQDVLTRKKHLLKYIIATFAIVINVFLFKFY